MIFLVISSCASLLFDLKLASFNPAKKKPKTNPHSKKKKFHHFWVLYTSNIALFFGVTEPKVKSVEKVNDFNFCQSNFFFTYFWPENFASFFPAINECKIPNICGRSAACQDLTVGYRCLCPVGFWYDRSTLNCQSKLKYLLQSHRSVSLLFAFLVTYRLHITTIIGCCVS